MKMPVIKISTDTSPHIQGPEVTFIYKGHAETVFLAGDYNRWELEDQMTRLNEGDVWYIQKTFPENARFDYKYIVDGNWITDPLNPQVTPGGAGENSTLIMPAYRSEYEEIIAQGGPGGTLLENKKIFSKYLRREMNYHVYLPYGYARGNVRHILYALDGSDYLHFSKINRVLDYMMHRGQIPPAVVVLADPGERTKEYTLHKPHFSYFVKELMPLVEEEWFREGNTLDRGIIGVSWGGLTALALAILNPGKFHRVLSQSGSFWPKDWLIFRMVQETALLPVYFCLQTGTIQDTEEMNDPMAELLTAKGYHVDYEKYAESHSWGNWKGHLNEGLKTLYKEGEMWNGRK